MRIKLGIFINLVSFSNALLFPHHAHNLLTQGWSLITLITSEPPPHSLLSQEACERTLLWDATEPTPALSLPPRWA